MNFWLWLAIIAAIIGLLRLAARALQRIGEELCVMLFHEED